MSETFRYCYHALDRDPRLAFYVRSCGYFNLIPPDRESFRDCVDFGEIFWCIRGSGVFRDKFRKTILTPEHVWYYPPGSSHDYYPRGSGFEYRWLTIEGSGTSQLFSGLNISPGLCYAGPCPQNLFSLVELNIDSMEQTARMQALSAAFQILTMLTFGQKTERIHGGMAEHARSLIYSGFSNRDFNVEKLASLLNVHRGSLSQAFRKKYGITVSHCITNCRVQCAARLLAESQLSIRQIALNSGFSSQDYFSHVFTAQTGFTPSSYRRQRINVKQEE